MKTLITGSEIRNEAEKENEIFTFPDLVYKELLAILAAMIVLCVWSLFVDAPLKEIADPNWTENPAKAPWYFVGLQEVLVYFDPWIAGVCLPFFIIFGLMCLPYIDPNPKGVGSYGFRGRRLAISIFLCGYALWFGLILIGQFLRGPSWHFYWPWEDWSIVKPPEPPLSSLPNSTGLSLIAAYFGAGLLLSALYARKRFQQADRLKFLFAWVLILLMFSIPGKMLLRIFFHLKYIITTTHFSV
ncbi:MAG: hypothetical protein ACOZF0_06105 [Thermodesulfobacteriota bacterium]